MTFFEKLQIPSKGYLQKYIPLQFFDILQQHGGSQSVPLTFFGTIIRLKTGREKVGKSLESLRNPIVSNRKFQISPKLSIRFP